MKDENDSKVSISGDNAKPLQPQLSKRKKTGTEKTQEIIESIIALIAQGISVVKICSRKDMPSQDSFYRWLASDNELMEKYLKAKEVCAHKYVEEIIEIADAATEKAEMEKAKLQIDARKWAAAKLHPKKYGDKIDIRSGTPAIDKIEVEIITPDH